MNQTVDRDEEHLRLLAIFHFVAAAITGLFAMFPILHLLVGIALVLDVFPKPANEPDFPNEFGWFFIVMAGGFMLFGFVVTLLLVLSGRALRRRTNHTFCIVVAAISCLFMPYGTVLGVFTIIVLMRASVQARFS